MSSQLPSPQEIARWRPPSLNYVVGCHRVKDALHSFLRNDGRGPNLFISGHSGSGKTVSVNAFVRTLICPMRGDESPEPCEQCEDCRTFDVRHLDEGLFAAFRRRVLDHGKEPVNFHPVNCGAVTEAELRKLLRIEADFSGHNLIYLDEVHRLINRHMDEMLLKPLEELKATWIASSAHPGLLDFAFRRRFGTRVATSVPSEEELATFLADRCREWSIKVDDVRTLVLLATRSRRIVSECQGFLASAAARPSRSVDRDFLDGYVFLDDGPE